MTGVAVEVGLVDRLAAGVLTGQVLGELATVVELAGSASRTIAESVEGAGDGPVAGDNVVVLLEALGMTAADLSGPERGLLLYLGGEERPRVLRLARLIRRSRAGAGDG